MSTQVYTVGIVGLGSMGMGMARSCLRAGLKTHGFDVDAARVQGFQGEGGQKGDLAQAAPGLDALVLVVVNADQAESVLFGSGLNEKLKPGAVVLGCPTMAPAVAVDFEARLAKTGVHYLDAPISGGSVKSAAGALTIMASGTPEAFAAAKPVLDATAETVFELGDRAGPGSAMKSVNQLLAGVHIAAAAEAVVFGATQGIPPARTLEVISRCAGTSWMFENRVPHIVAGDYTPHSAVNIFVKDLGIVASASEGAGYDPHLTKTALAQFKAAQGMGLGREDDAAVAKAYAAQAGVKLPGDE